VSVPVYAHSDHNSSFGFHFARGGGGEGRDFSGPLRILYCMYFVTCNDGAATAAAAILVRSLSIRKIHAAARLAGFPNCKIPMAALPRAAVAQASCFIGQLFRRVAISKCSCFTTGVSQNSCFTGHLLQSAVVSHCRKSTGKLFTVI
jgi:hypothetical protein